MKNSFWILLILVSAMLACSLSPETTEETADDPRTILRDSQPSVVILAPQEGYQYALGATILIHAEARDLGEGITRIEFYDHFDQVINSVEADDPEGVESMTATTTWIATEAQLVFLKARAFRADGTASEIAEVPIRVVVPSDIQATSDAAPTATTVALTEEPEAAATSATTPTVAVPSAEETEAAEPLALTLIATVKDTDVLNIRQRPDVAASILRTAARGEDLEIVGRTEDNLWYATSLENGTYGWVFGQYLDFGGTDPSALPPATAQ